MNMTAYGVIDGWPGEYWLQQRTNHPLPSVPRSELIERSTFLLRESEPLQENIRKVVICIKSLANSHDKKEREVQENLLQNLTSELFHSYLKEVALNRAKLYQ